MLSLDNAMSVDDLREFEARLRRALPGARFAFVGEPKIDGLGVALLYQRGRFVRGATRGDGRVGEDVTPTLATLGAIPKTLRGPLAAARGWRCAERSTCRSRPSAGSTPASRRPARSRSRTRAMPPPARSARRIPR